MTPEKEALLTEHLEAVAALLYEETELEQMESLAAVEATVREQTLKYITPQLGFFLSSALQEKQQEEREQ